MKKYVITILDNPYSVQAADRCIESAEQFGYEVEKFPAITPADNPHKIFKEEGLPTKKFENNPYSRYEPALCCFLSHYFLWKKCVEDDWPILILEHDAVFKSSLPAVFEDMVSYGKPSYGAFKTPPSEGLWMLFSKEGGYLPGAHAYALSSRGAEEFINEAPKSAQPTDVFINKAVFPELREYYPWPVVVEDSVSTVQEELGCLAKHNRVVPV